MRAEFDQPLLPCAFRDTALTVAILQSSKKDHSFKELRSQCLGQIERLRDELKAGGHPADVIDDASYAQCALLDEAALRHLEPDDRQAWEREPLQISVFGTHRAGNELIDRMNARLQTPSSILPLLAIFHAALSLGFRGRLDAENEAAYDKLLGALGERLDTVDTFPEGLVIGAASRRGWLASNALLVLALMSLLVACVAYVMLDRWLDQAVARLAS